MKFFTTDGNVTDLDVRKYSLPELYELVGDPIELSILCSKPFIAVIVNENGLLSNLPVNEKFVEYLKANNVLFYPKIVGNVLCLNNREDIDTVMN